MNISTKFGFSTITLDFSLRVYACKIVVENPVMLPDIAGITLNHKFKERKGMPTNVYTIRYCTTDPAEAHKMSKEIMLYLEKHAMQKVQQKYAWLHEQEDFSKELVLDMEDLPKWEEFPA
jgi:hypothetical protein